MLICICVFTSYHGSVLSVWHPMNKLHQIWYRYWIKSVPSLYLTKLSKKNAKLSEQAYNRARVGFIIILLHPNCDKLTFWNRTAAQHRRRVRCWNWPFSFGRSAVRQWSYQTFPSKIIRVNINQKWLSFSFVTPATSCIIYPTNRSRKFYLSWCHFYSRHLITLYWIHLTVFIEKCQSNPCTMEFAFH